MDHAGVLADAFNRVSDFVHEVLDELDPDDLVWQPEEGGNTIGWLVWHLARIQDDHVAGVAGREQVWTAQGWVDRLKTPFDAADTGYGHSAEQVAQVQVSGRDLVEYFDAVHAHTQQFVATLSADDLDRVVDKQWNPPVTLGVRLVSVIADDLQHVGQAAYVRGMLP
jgi:uncharacterized damage-inducible protein DinB